MSSPEGIKWDNPRIHKPWLIDLKQWTLSDKISKQTPHCNEFMGIHGWTAQGLNAWCKTFHASTTKDYAITHIIHYTYTYNRLYTIYTAYMQRPSMIRQNIHKSKFLVCVHIWGPGHVAHRVVVSVCCGTLLFATHSANSTKKKRQTVLIPWERTNAMTSCAKLSFCTSQFNFLHKTCFAHRHEHPLHCSTNHSVFANRRLDPVES